MAPADPASRAGAMPKASGDPSSRTFGRKQKLPLTMRVHLLCLIFILGASDIRFAFKESFNRPYVQSGCDGIFYARCIPAADSGSAGYTDIYRVQTDKDKLIDHYDWFTKHGIYLGWSPIAGKVAVMAIPKDAPTTPEQQIEFAFYLGGQKLRQWTTADLANLGATVEHSFYGGKRAVYSVLGCKQIPNTNEYIFAIKIADKEIAFDILTGDTYKK